MLSLSQYVFFHQFACNHQLIFDYSQMMTSLADIKGKFYNLGVVENGKTGQECHGINERSLRDDEITTSLAAINSGTTRPTEKDR